ncbi:hypothetical protein PAXINDRAFT_11911 [Paxillus involutus ATCC 200175]|uniref:Uncharacterized protein n=1 Tax=Paxillus involutus ATCC 200175 TaxID=664439 RepID=A0A0C9TYH6_PAXIN|nr:hypothetical protein PAXINDRAFT_11911 [Paxillus involutus ATCC 200175]
MRDRAEMAEKWERVVKTRSGDEAKDVEERHNDVTVEGEESASMIDDKHEWKRVDRKERGRVKMGLTTGVEDDQHEAASPQEPPPPAPPPSPNPPE